MSCRVSCLVCGGGPPKSAAVEATRIRESLESSSKRECKMALSPSLPQSAHSLSQGVPACLLGPSAWTAGGAEGAGSEHLI